jgi:hypothetical protein
MVVALGARLWYIGAVARKLAVVGDAETYHLLARVLAAGDGYVRPRELFELGRSVPTAEFPPLHPFVLAVADLVGINTPNGQRVVGAFLGVVTVALVGLLARRISGPRAGLVAAGLAALSPVLIEHDTSLYSEGLYALLVTACLLAIHVAMTDARTATPRPASLVLLGLLLGAAALSRSEALLLVPVAAVLVSWRPGRPSAAAVARTLALVGVGTLLVVGTWAVRSSMALGAFVPTSTNAGTLVAGANCDAVYGGEQKGLWRLDCVRAVDVTDAEFDEAERYRRWIAAGRAYAADHAAELPGVAGVRVLRTWGLWDAEDQVIWETLEGRDRDFHRFAHRVHVVMLALAVAGFVVLRRRPRELVLLLTPVIAAVVVSALSAGNTRFRAGADPVLVVAAAIAIDATLVWWLARRSRSAVAEVPPEPGG